MLVLASASPRRKALLEQVGLRPQLMPMDIDESVLPDEAPEAYVERLACAKAAAAAKRYGKPGVYVIAADTTVVAGGQILGKPESFEDANRIWDLLPAPDHRVLTGVAVQSDQGLSSMVVTTHVSFLPIPMSVRKNYWRSGEPVDKAGAYAIQGYASAFIERIEGSYTNVVGLPLAQTLRLLRDHGLELECLP